MNDRSLRSFLNLSHLSLISLPTPPFQVGLNQMYASMLILEDSPYISNAPCLCTYPLIEYDQKNFAIHTIHEGRNPNSSSQTLKISMPTY